MVNNSLVACPRSLYAAVLETRNYIVGEANAPSGLYQHGEEGWVHAGWRNLRCTAIALTADPDTLFLGAGNGVLRSRNGGITWRVTTDWRVAEVLGLALDPEAAGSLYAASAHGVWHTANHGDTWCALPAPAARPNATFTAALVLDRQRPGRLVIGTADGLYESEDRGQKWRSIGPRVAVRALEQSATHPNVWLAGTDESGALVSTDSGATWSVRVAEATIYAVAIDPADVQRMAAGGYETGVLCSVDGGMTWERRAIDAPTQTLHALAFDPDGSGRLWLGTVGEGVVVTDDLGQTYATAGLPETTVYDFAFAKT